MAFTADSANRATKNAYDILPAVWLNYRTHGIYNVLDFGATGDGVTDDSVAIQAAIDAAGDNYGGIIYLPFGAYGFSTELIVPERVNVWGQGNGHSSAGASALLALGADAALRFGAVGAAGQSGG